MSNKTPDVPESDYPKLVRDNIPAIIREREGKQAVTQRLDDDQAFLQALFLKVVEEAEELANARGQHLTEELADLYEVIDTILAVKGLTRSDIDAAQQQKRQKRGGFSERLLLVAKQ